MKTNKFSKYLAIIVIINAMILTTSTWAQTSTSTSTSTSAPDMSTQQTTCNANTAMVWDSTLNRCMNKIQEQQYQKASADCGKITDLEQQKACQMNLASQQTGVTSNANQAMNNTSSLQDRAALINGASTVIAVINWFAGKDGTNNTCMSKSILAVTSIGGTITDILMKMKTQKAAENLIKKYQITKTDSPYSAQTKALEYLREEQQTVRDMAEMEKNRQTLLLIGYGAAFATAAYEQWYNDGACVGKSETAPAASSANTTTASTANTTTATESSAASNASSGAIATPVRQGEVITTVINPTAPVASPTLFSDTGFTCTRNGTNFSLSGDYNINNLGNLGTAGNSNNSFFITRPSTWDTNPSSYTNPNLSTP